jgi:hypothetical protein
MLNVILLNVVAPFQAQKCQCILKFFVKKNEQNNLEANLFQICLQQLQHPIRGQGGINTLCYIDVCVPVLLL